MCEDMEIEDTVEWGVGFTDGWGACRRHALRVINEAKREIGIPQEDYPAPIANAYKILKGGRSRMRLSLSREAKE